MADLHALVERWRARGAALAEKSDRDIAAAGDQLLECAEELEELLKADAPATLTGGPWNPRPAHDLDVDAKEVKPTPLLDSPD